MWTSARRVERLVIVLLETYKGKQKAEVKDDKSKAGDLEKKEISRDGK